MSTPQPSQRLLGLDRTNTAFHPDAFLRSPSATEPSTASVFSNGKKKVHFNGESVGESSGTQPTSIASADAPEADEDNSKHQNIPEERVDHTSIQHGSLHHTLNSLGGHLPDIHLGGDFEADVVSSTVPATTALPPTSNVDRLYHRRSKNAWVRKHKPTKYPRHTDKPKIHDLAVERKTLAMPVEIRQESAIQGRS